MQQQRLDLSNPKLPENINRGRIPVIEATPESLEEYGFIVDEPEDFQIEISRWGLHRVGVMWILILEMKEGLPREFLKVNGKGMYFMEETMPLMETTS